MARRAGELPLAWAPHDGGASARGAEERGGRARQIVSRLNYRDEELVLRGAGDAGGVAREGEEEWAMSTVNGQLSMEERDPWVAACGRVQSRQDSRGAGCCDHAVD